MQAGQSADWDGGALKRTEVFQAEGGIQCCDTGQYERTDEAGKSILVVTQNKMMNLKMTQYVSFNVLLQNQLPTEYK